MTFMTWSGDLETGIDIVDRQHHHLLDMINSAAGLMLENPEPKNAEIERLFADLFDYAGSHFRTEEEMMQAHGIDARILDHHRHTHSSFVEQIREMASRYRAGSLPGEDLLGYLAGWLLFHTLGEDQTMARQIHAIDRGLPPQRAYQEADGARLEPEQSALARTMVTLYTQLSGQIRELGLHGQHLEEQVRERTAHLRAMTDDLAQARDAAEAANQAKSRFLAAVSHELRTPMNAVLGFAHLLQGAHLPSNQGDLAHKIVDASEHLLKLINDVIDYARLDTRQDTHTEVSFALRHCLDEACAEAFETARRKGISCRTEIDPALPARFLCDSKRLVSAFRQFAANAAKFTEHGMIVASARRLAMKSGQIQVRFAMLDTGIGIAPEQQTRLFQAFQQLDDSASRKYAGIGLGLALAQHLAQELGGTVGMQSQAGRGSKFWLDLWLTPDPSHPEQQPESPPTTGSKSVETAAVSTSPGTERLLARLAQLLSQGDTRAGELIATDAPALRARLGDRFEAISGQISRFEYDRALATLNELEPRLTDNLEVP